MSSSRLGLEVNTDFRVKVLSIALTTHPCQPLFDPPGNLCCLRCFMYANTTNLAIDLAAPQRRLNHIEQRVREPVTFPHSPAGLLSGWTNIPAKQKHGSAPSPRPPKERSSMPISSHLFFFSPRHIACGISVPWPEIQPVSPALAGQSLNRWITREVPSPQSFNENTLLAF